MCHRTGGARSIDTNPHFQAATCRHPWLAYPFAMRPITLLLALIPSTAFADTIDRERLKQIDTAAESAIKRGDCPGAVVLVLHNDSVVFRKAFGNRSLQPEKVAMTPDTVFDMAS